ncbi:MAG TPA: hypothetical protein VL334_02485, partial [Anaerolineae bacterium]|nr:hypothetical protein [Anaerolineae bacterium]
MRKLLLVLGMALMSLVVVASALAAPSVNNDVGTWVDTYNDELGVFSTTNVVNDPAAGVMKLAAGQASGNYVTVQI